jgi:hypothetical protein
VNAGQNATFTAAANANPSATVQWQVSSDGGATFRNISGATSTTLTLTHVTTTMNGNEYRAIFTNSVGTATTTAATLTVNAPPPPPPPAPPPAHPSPLAPPPPLILHVPPLLAFFDSLLGGVETVNSNGIETVTDSIFGIVLFVSTYNSVGDWNSPRIVDTELRGR